MDKAGDVANNTMKGVNDTVDEAKEQFMRMLKNKNKWGVLFLFLVIIFSYKVQVHTIGVAVVL